MNYIFIFKMSAVELGRTEAPALLSEQSPPAPAESSCGRQLTWHLGCPSGD